MAVVGGRGVYEAFRAEFPRLEREELRVYAAEWKEYSEIYRVLLDPAHASDVESSRELAFLNVFGGAGYPLLMRAYRDHVRGTAEAEAFARTARDLQALLLRRTVVGLPIDGLVARLCRAGESGPGDLRHAMSRITPSDERVRAALKYRDLPHPRVVLGRLADLDATDDVEVEHIFPAAPGENWSGDGRREWSGYSEDEQNSHRALAQTVGNLTLLEQSTRGARVGSVVPGQACGLPAKRRRHDFGSRRDRVVGHRGDLPADHGAHDGVRACWPRPGLLQIDDDGLTPILDARRRRGWPAGWQREFSYVEYRGEHWEVYDIKHLFNRIFKRMWADARPALMSFTERRGGPVYSAKSWNGHWDHLDDSHFLYMGWDSQYMLTAVQDVLEEAGLAAEVFVKYSYIGDAMK